MTELLAPVTATEKQKWLDGPGKDTFIAAYARCSDKFLNTSCLLTVAVLRYRLSCSVWWENEVPRRDIRSRINSGHPLEIGFYEEDNEPLLDPDHVLIIVGGLIGQSMYGQYEWIQERVNETILNLFESEKISRVHLAQLTKTEPELWRVSSYFIKALEK
jgi:hypothetical protein